MKGLVALVVLLVAIGLGLFLQRLIVDDPAWQHTLTINGSSVTLHRQPTKSGMFHIYGRDHIDFARAVGMPVPLSSPSHAPAASAHTHHLPHTTE